MQGTKTVPHRVRRIQKPALGTRGPDSGRRSAARGTNETTTLRSGPTPGSEGPTRLQAKTGVMSNENVSCQAKVITRRVKCSQPLTLAPGGTGTRPYNPPRHRRGGPLCPPFGRKPYPRICSAAFRAVKMQQPRNVPSRALRPWLPPPPKPAASPAA